jgi:membrane protein YqaA with SNARE-associated domain
MGSLSTWVVGLFASPLGIVVLAALDSTIFFSLPFGIDAAVVILAARAPAVAWLVPLLATAGSVGGAALTFWMGRQIGEKGLERYVSPSRLRKIHNRIRKSGAVALAVLDLIPPPFPFTAFIIAAGALEVKTRTFFVTLVVCRVFRFGVEALLAVIYGSRILGWMESPIFQGIVNGCIVLAFALTAFSLYRVVRSTRQGRSNRRLTV